MNSKLKFHLTKDEERMQLTLIIVINANSTQSRRKLLFIDFFVFFRVLEKRARQAGFSSWAGKRGGRNNQQAFSSWAGKRSGRDQQAFSSWAGKRAPFNSWAGKRSGEEEVFHDPEYVRYGVIGI